MTPTTLRWPPKYDVLGVEVSATDYDELVRLFIAAARRHESALATFFSVHGAVVGATDNSYRYRLNAFEVVAPDGQPIRWTLNGLHKAGLTDRVYGPELMIRL